MPQFVFLTLVALTIKIMKGKILNSIIFCGVFFSSISVLKAQELAIPPPPEIYKDTAEIFVSVEQMPIFPGGQEEIIPYINKNIEYPKTAKDKSGTVYISFVINKEKCKTPRC